MQRNILHYGGWGRNYGDLAIKHNVKAMFDLSWGGHLHFDYMDLKSPTPITSAIIEVINEHYDMLLVGGGGLAMAGDGFATRSGWQFNCALDDLVGLKVPLVVYGIGYNAFPRQGDDLTPQAWNHLHEVQKMSALFSVRDEGTNKAFQANGLEPSEVIPDPGMFITSGGLTFKDLKLPIDDSKPVIGICWAGDRESNRFTATKDKFECAKRLVQQVSYYFNEKGGGTVLPLIHVDRYDREPWDMLRMMFAQDCVFPIWDYLPEMWPESDVCLPLLVSLYENCTQVIGMRGHSNIISYGCLVPSIAFGDHPKNRFFAEEVGGIVVGSNSVGLAQALEQLEPKNYDYDSHGKTLGELAKKSMSFNNKVLNLL